MMVRTVPGTEKAELWWIDPQWQGPRLPGYTRVEIVLKPSGTSIDGYAYGGRFVGQTGFVIDDLEDPFLRTFGESDAIQVSAGNRMLVDIPLPLTGPALAALRQCEDDSLRRWGLDPKVIRSLRVPVKEVESPAHWVSDADYPDTALQQEASGSVLTRLKVDATGLVSDCLVVESSGNAALDETTCRILRKRGRFHPAIDADGKPTTGLTAIRIRWLTAPA
jgi:TonB family protein